MDQPIAFVIPVMEHRLEQEIVQWAHHDPLHHEQMLYHWTNQFKKEKKYSTNELQW